MNSDQNMSAVVPVCMCTPSRRGAPPERQLNDDRHSRQQRDSTRNTSLHKLVFSISTSRRLVLRQPADCNASTQEQLNDCDQKHGHKATARATSRLQVIVDHLCERWLHVSCAFFKKAAGSIPVNGIGTEPSYIFDFQSLALVETLTNK